MLLVMLAALSVPAPPMPSPGPRTQIVSFVAGEVVCDGVPVAADGLARPRPIVLTRYGTAAADVPPTYAFTFRIDAQGRAATIRHVPAASTGFYVDTGDLAPALAASRLPAGTARSGCTIGYAPSVASVDSASPALLYEVASLPETAGRAATIDERLRPAGSTCPAGPGQYRRLNLPAFETLPPPSGGSAWVFLTYDVDRAGKPHHARVLGSSGDAALDRAGTAALLANRYAPGPGYRGCTHRFFQNGRSDRLSPQLPEGSPPDNGDQPGCAVEPASIATLLNGSAYPRAFSQRRIEGVAMIGYSTAPWGAIGDVKILASEPDEAFGDAARNAFQNARVPESEAGRRGCIRHVRFRLPPERPMR